MNIITLAALGAAGYVGYRVLGGGDATPTTAGTWTQTADRTPVLRGNRVLSMVEMQRAPDEPQLVVNLEGGGGSVVVSARVTVTNGIWHEYIPGKGASSATEKRRTGLNACGYARWRGLVNPGAALTREVNWVSVKGCPADTSKAPGGNLLSWLTATARVDVGNRLLVTLWNASDRYRGNHYDIRFDWAWIPPA